MTSEFRTTGSALGARYKLKHHRTDVAVYKLSHRLHRESLFQLQAVTNVNMSRKILYSALRANRGHKFDQDGVWQSLI
jgi:hypothetical protein